MSKDRARSVRLWPLVCIAAALWLGWVLTAQSPHTWQNGEQFYLSAQRGCVGVWYWAPADRPSLGVHDRLAFTANRLQPVANIPFAWCDAWGFGAGTPLWLPALIVTTLAARRYAVTAVRDAPPATRRARRWVVVLVVLWGTVTLGLIVSARHRTEPVVTYGGKELKLENGALVYELPEVPPPTPPIMLSSSRVVFAGTVTGSSVPSRQGWLLVDLVPDVDIGATGGGWRLAFPLWPLVVTLGWVAWKSRTAAAFKGSGLCSGCGYSLVGLKPGSPCPECGVRRNAPNITPPEGPPAP